MDEEKGSYLDDLSVYEMREVIDTHPLSGMTLEEAFNSIDLTRYYIIVLEGQLIKHEFKYETNSNIKDYYEGMKHGYKIAAHKNEAKELMREMGMDDV